VDAEQHDSDDELAVPDDAERFNVPPGNMQTESAATQDDAAAAMQQFARESAAEAEKHREGCILSIIKAPANGGYGIAYFEETVRLSPLLFTRASIDLNGFYVSHFFS
jgi:hypothetical protein